MFAIVKLQSYNNVTTIGVMHDAWSRVMRGISYVVYNARGIAQEKVSGERLYNYNPVKHYDSSYYLGTYRQMDVAFVVEQLEQ